MLAMAVAFTVLWLTITRDVGVLHAHLDPAAGRAALRRFGLGMIVYAGTVVLAFVNAYLTLAVHGALALYYCFNQLGNAIAAPPPSG